MKVYLSGPIAGQKNPRAAFEHAAEVVNRELWQQFAIPVTIIDPFDIAPHQHDGRGCRPGYSPGAGADGHTSSACYMLTDLQVLLDCDAIWMIPGWSLSRGAMVEHAVAVAIGLAVYGAPA